MSDPHAYHFAFRVGMAGTILLSLFTVLFDTLTGLSVLALWSILIMPFVLPWFYVIYTDKIGQIPYWAIRGPHQ